MDLVLKLRELRKMCGLSQAEAARISGVGVKTISSFETGGRIESLKLEQLRKLLAAYGTTEEEFFGGVVETRIGATVPNTTEALVIDAVRQISKLPGHLQRALAMRLSDMVGAAKLAAQ